MDEAAFGPERLVEVEGPTVGNPVATLARWSARFGGVADVFAGDGASLYAEEIKDAAPAGRITAPTLIAGAMARMALARRSEAVAPAVVRALYVRRPDAEIARDEKLGLSGIDSEAH
jgi:hypothetical protein